MKRAIQFTKTREQALDVGCGCSGRFVELLKRDGFHVEGVDVSKEMIALARKRQPDVTFHHAEISEWALPRSYDFIAAWDSTWHLPLALQEPVLTKLCAGLKPGGVFIFTTGGLDAPSEKWDSSMGPPVYYGVLGVPKTLEVLHGCGCICRHLEYDQPPEKHLYIIAQRS